MTEENVTKTETSRYMNEKNTTKIEEILEDLESDGSSESAAIVEIIRDNIYYQDGDEIDFAKAIARSFADSAKTLLTELEKIKLGDTECQSQKDM
jgi:hypothetical protein